MQFYKCKLNVHQNIFHGNVKDIINFSIPRALVGVHPIRAVFKGRPKRLDFKQQIVNVEKIEDNVIIGMYREMRPEDFEECDDNGEKKSVHIENKVYEEYRFIYFITEEYLWIEKKGKKSIEKVAKEFGDYLTYLDVTIGKLKIEPNPDIISFRKALKDVQGVTEVSIRFIAPNPRDPKFYEDVKKSYKVPNIHSGCTVLKTHNPWNGKELEGNQFINDAIENSDLGYGSVVFKKDKTVILSTKKSIVSASLEELFKERENILAKIPEDWRK